MLCTASFLFANRLTLKWFLILTPALYFSGLKATCTCLFNAYFTICTGAFMTTSRTNMPAFQFFRARHPANRYVIFTTFSILRISSQHLNFVFSTRACFLLLGSLHTRTAFPRMTLLLAFMKSTIQYLIASLITRI